MLGSVSRYLAAFGPSRAPSGALAASRSSYECGVWLVTDTMRVTLGSEEEHVLNTLPAYGTARHPDVGSGTWK